MQAERRPGRPPTMKQVQLKQKMDDELMEYGTGYYVPDLRDWGNIESLKRWDGTEGSLSQVKFTRTARESKTVEADTAMEA